MTHQLGRGITVLELASYPYLQLEVNGISISALDRNIRNYCGQGLLKRDGMGHRYDPYRYSLTHKGLDKIYYLISLPSLREGENKSNPQMDEERAQIKYLRRKRLVVQMWQMEDSDRDPLISISARKSKLDALEILEKSGLAERNIVEYFREYLLRTPLEKVIYPPQPPSPDKKTPIEKIMKKELLRYKRIHINTPE
jgi:hypothetical protein